MKEFKTIKEVKEYVRGFKNPDRYEVTIDGEIPSEEDVRAITLSEREGIAHDFEYIEINHLDFVGNQKVTTIRIMKNAGCML